MNLRALVILITSGITALTVTATPAEPIAVRQPQGTTRGFLLIRSQQGKLLADGDLSQQVHGDRITTRVLYRFRDGSIDDDTTVFTQRDHFKLVSDHHIQRGPFFPDPIDVTVDAASGTITSRSVGKDGKPKVETEHKDIPPDLYNGVVGLILLNVPPNAAPFNVSFLAPIGKGRIIKLAISPDGTGEFTDAGRFRKASIFRIKLEIGGIAGAIAPLVGKQPDDVLVWVVQGEVPALVREVGSLFPNGPTVSVELSGASFADHAPEKP